MKKILKLLASLALAALVIMLSFIGYTPRDMYMAAEDAMERGDYTMARTYVEYLNTPRAYALLERLYLVPTRVTTTYGDGTVQVLTHDYDEMGDMVADTLTENKVELSSVQYAYAPDGQLLSANTFLPQQTEPETVVQQEYDQRGNLIYQATSGADGRLQEIRYTYDEKDRLLSETKTVGDDKTAIEYSYDLYDNGEVKIKQVESKDSLVISQYDEQGKITARMTTNDGESTLSESFTYDEAGRLIQVDHSDGRVITYQYTESGQLLQRLERYPGGGRQRIWHTYNDMGLIAKRTVTDTAEPGDYTERYRYNTKGQCVRYEYNNQTTGQWKDYTYDYGGQGQLKEEIYLDNETSYTRVYKWGNRYYTDGLPKSVLDLMDKYTGVTADLPEEEF